MLPVSAWPPGPPGSSLSPFGPPRCVKVPPCGYVLPKGAWIVQTGANQVVMFRPSWEKALYNQPTQQMGTGYLPGQWQWRYGKPPSGWIMGQGGRPIPQVPVGNPPGPITNATQTVSRETLCPPPKPCPPRRRPTHNQYLEGWRAWQRCTGRTDPPIRPIPGRVPPNFAGWNFVSAPRSTLINFGQSGLVLADGQNVVLMGGGTANITQAFSV